MVYIITERQHYLVEHQVFLKYLAIPISLFAELLFIQAAGNAFSY